MKTTRSILLALLLLSTFTGISQNKWFVNKGLTGTQNGQSWADAFHELQPAISAASSGDSIFVAVGTYKPTTIVGTGSDPRDKSFLLKNGIRIYGGFAGNELTLSQRDSSLIHTANRTNLSGDIGVPVDSSDNCYHIVVVVNNTTTTVLDGFNIINGNASVMTNNVINSVSMGRNFGGGISTVNSALLINDCRVFYNLALSGGAGMNNKTGNGIIVSNSSFSVNKIWGSDPNNFGGGAMRNENCSPTINSVNFIGNRIKDIQGGGAMRNEASSHPIISHSYFDLNRSDGGDGGAGMYNASGSNPIITNVVFENNITSNQGGGMYNDNSIPNLQDVLFQANMGLGGGGAMENDGGSNAVLTRVAFNSNNTDEDGGAIQNWKSSPALTEVSFINNSAGQDGGAIFNYTDCSPKIINSTFTGNTAIHNGGAIYNRRNSNPILTNILVTNNTAGAYGGGIYSVSSNSSPCSPVVTNATVSNNHADTSGGGGYDDGAGNSKLRNSIISGNTSPGEADVDAPSAMAATALFRVIIGTDYYVTGLIPPTVVSSNLFIDPINNNFELVSGSPAINEGDSVYFNTGQTPDLSSIKTDIRFAKRTMGSNTDLGAYEVCGDTLAPQISVSANPGNTVIYGSTVTFTVVYSASGSSPVFIWMKNSMVIPNSGSTYVGIAGTDFVSGDVISVNLQSSNPCDDPNSAISNNIEMTVTTGLYEEANKNNNYLIYPNPSNGLITIKGNFKRDEDYIITVFDLVGSVISIQRISGEIESHSIDLLSLPKGMYLVNVLENNRQVYAQPLIIK